MAALPDSCAKQREVITGAQDIAKKPYQFLLVNVLREYLTLEFAVSTPFALDVERIFDDFGAR